MKVPLRGATPGPPYLLRIPTKAEENSTKAAIETPQILSCEFYFVPIVQFYVKLTGGQIPGIKKITRA